MKTTTTRKLTSVEMASVVRLAADQRALLRKYTAELAGNPSNLARIESLLVSLDATGAMLATGRA